MGGVVVGVTCSVLCQFGVTLPDIPGDPGSQLPYYLEFSPSCLVPVPTISVSCLIGVSHFGAGIHPFSKLATIHMQVADCLTGAVACGWLAAGWLPGSLVARNTFIAPSSQQTGRVAASARM